MQFFTAGISPSLQCFCGVLMGMVSDGLLETDSDSARPSIIIIKHLIQLSVNPTVNDTDNIVDI